MLFPIFPATSWQSCRTMAASRPFFWPFPLFRPASLTSSPLVPGVIGILRSFASFEPSPLSRQPSFDYLSTTHPRQARTGRKVQPLEEPTHHRGARGPTPSSPFTSQPDCGSERIIDEGFGLARPSVSPALQLVQQDTLDSTLSPCVLCTSSYSSTSCLSSVALPSRSPASFRA